MMIDPANATDTDIRRLTLDTFRRLLEHFGAHGSITINPADKVFPTTSHYLSFRSRPVSEEENGILTSLDFFFCSEGLEYNGSLYFIFPSNEFPEEFMLREFATIATSKMNKTKKGE